MPYRSHLIGCSWHLLSMAVICLIVACEWLKLDWCVLLRLSCSVTKGFCFFLVLVFVLTDSLQITDTILRILFPFFSFPLYFQVVCLWDHSFFLPFDLLCWCLLSCFKFYFKKFLLEEFIKIFFKDTFMYLKDVVTERQKYPICPFSPVVAAITSAGSGWNQEPNFHPGPT